MGSSDRPAEECYSHDRHDNCFGCEEMAEGLDGEPVSNCQAWLGFKWADQRWRKRTI